MHEVPEHFDRCKQITTDIKPDDEGVLMGKQPQCRTNDRLRYKND